MNSINTYIPIVFATDNNYAIGAGIAIYSLIQNKDQKTCYEINLIATNVSDENLARFKKMERSDVIINLIPFDTKHIVKFNRQGYHVTCTGLLRFDIPDLFPQHDKIIYLDSDIIVTTDLTEMYHLDLKNTYAGVIKDIGSQVCIAEEKKPVVHGNTHLKNYFNSGVMLLNAKKNRNEHLREKLYHAVTQHPEFIWIDQDALNLLYNENVTFLPIKYNCAPADALSLEIINEIYGTHYISHEELYNDAIILHYTTPTKPWNSKFGFKRDTWISYYQSSPFNDLPLTHNDYYESSLKLNGTPLFSYIKPNTGAKIAYLLNFKIYERITNGNKHNRHYLIKLFGIKVFERTKSSEQKVLKLFNIPISVKIFKS